MSHPSGTSGNEKRTGRSSASATLVTNLLVPGSTIAPRHPESVRVYSMISALSFVLSGTGHDAGAHHAVHDLDELEAVADAHGHAVTGLEALRCQQRGDPVQIGLRFRHR